MLRWLLYNFCLPPRKLLACQYGTVQDSVSQTSFFSEIRWALYAISTSGRRNLLWLEPLAMGQIWTPRCFDTGVSQGWRLSEIPVPETQTKAIAVVFQGHGFLLLYHKYALWKLRECLIEMKTIGCIEIWRMYQLVLEDHISEDNRGLFRLYQIPCCSYLAQNLSLSSPNLARGQEFCLMFLLPCCNKWPTVLKDLISYILEKFVPLQDNLQRPQDASESCAMDQIYSSSLDNSLTPLKTCQQTWPMDMAIQKCPSTKSSVTWRSL